MTDKINYSKRQNIRLSENVAMLCACAVNEEDDNIAAALMNIYSWFNDFNWSNNFLSSDFLVTNYFILGSHTHLYNQQERTSYDDKNWPKLRN